MRKNCAECKNLRKSTARGFGSNFAVIGCSITKEIIPHHADFDSGIATFWRVPLSCPLPDDCVRKSETKANQSEWSKMNISDIKETK